jgi:hypothetical protein
MPEAARSQESEQHTRPVLTPGPKKLLDHAEGGAGRHYQQVLLRSGCFALGTDGTVVVDQSYRDAEPTQRVLVQLEALELESMQVDLRATRRLTMRSAETELQ